MIRQDLKGQTPDMLVKHQQYLQKQKDIVGKRMKKLAAKQVEITKKADMFKQKVQKKYEDMRRVLDEDLRITMNHLDVELEATELLLEDQIQSCYRVTQDLESQLGALEEQSKKEMESQKAETEKRVGETLKSTDPDLTQLDEFKNDQLLSLTINLLLFIRSQVPVTKKLFQSYASEVVLDADTAHPKLIISPAGNAATYTDAWQDVSDTPRRFDATLNVVSRQPFSEGRHYWEADVSGKTYWELGLTYPGISRKGGAEELWLGRGPGSWSVEYFNGTYTAWHAGVAHELAHVAGRQFGRIGVYCGFPGGMVGFLGADTMTPLHCFCAGTFADGLHQAVGPGHDNQGTNWTPVRICDASRSAPTL